MTKQVDVLAKKRAKEKLMDKFYLILPVLSVALLILVWVVASGGNDSMFPSPKATLDRLIMMSEKPIMKLSLLQHVMVSLYRVLTALGAAWILGIAFGVLIGWNKKCNAVFGPIFEGFRAIPPIAWIPLITIWFGIGEFPKMLIVFIGAFAPVVVNTQAGMRNVDSLYLDVGKIFNANQRQQLMEIAIPSAIPAIFAGIRTSTSTGWMVVLAAEMLGAKSGVGFLIVRGMDSGDMPLVLVAMITIGIVGAILAITTQYIERLVCPWTAKRSN